MAEQQGARDAAQAADLLVTVAASLNERLAITADELARSQAMLREASDELMTAFRGAADRIVAAQKVEVDNNQVENRRSSASSSTISTAPCSTCSRTTS
jgi:thiazolylpeptide-type bacteriocin precursor